MGNWISTVLFPLRAFMHGFFVGRKSRALLSPQDVLFPPISYVLAMNGRPDLLDQLNFYLERKNVNAIVHAERVLLDLGLANIREAFINGVEEKMICRRCDRQIKFIDSLCYCAASAEKCHCTGCCNNRKIKALTSGR